VTTVIAAEVLPGLLGRQPEPPAAVVVGAGLVAVLLVAWRPSWRVVRGVVTIAHEAGHAAAAALTGRTLLGVRLHSDTSGLTVTRGRPTGPGMVATLAAGYLAPSLLGLAAVVLLGAGRTTLLLWAATALLAGVLVLVRNLYGVLSVVATGAVVVLLGWFGSPAAQGAFAYLVAWLLLLAAPRPLVELSRTRRRGGGLQSDPDQLAALTRIPALLWIVAFGAVTVAVAVLGTWWLLPWDTLASAGAPG